MTIQRLVSACTRTWLKLYVIAILCGFETHEKYAE